MLIHDQPDRDAFASQLLRYRDDRGDDWADIIDMVTMHPEARRQVARLLVNWKPQTARRRPEQSAGSESLEEYACGPCE